MMSEGRSGQVILLDERKLEIPIQPKLYAGELLDIVASHFNLKEKEYFGLSYEDETGHHHWLQLDRKVLEHDFSFCNSKKTSSPNPPIVFYFMVKFYVETIIQLRENSTIELFYLQARHHVFKGVTEVDSDTAFQLAAFVLQVTHGDYIDDNLAKVQLKKLSVLPTSVLKEHPSLSFCHDEIISRYQKLCGLTRGQSIVNYMSIVETLPTYGVHYFQVKDKGGLPWWLGLSHKGVSQYDHTDKKNARIVFQWKRLENIYFRDKKFAIEVHDHKRVVHALSSFNLYEDAIEEPVDAIDDLSDAISDPTTQVSVSRRTFGPGNVTVYVWFAQTPPLTKCIWSMAISQHQFYLDTKHSRSRLVNSKRSISQIALELSRSCQSLSPASSLSSLSLSSSTQSLYFAKIEEEEQSAEVKAATLEMMSALKTRKQALEEALMKKNEELKLLCLKEGELIGSMPPEMPLIDGQNAPPVRKRIGTSFTISNNLIDKLKSSNEEVLAKLELEFEIQSKITSAALKLANDTSAKKSVRKARKSSYQMSHSKLKDIEKKLQDMRKAIKIVNHMKSCEQPQQSDDEPSEDNCSHSSQGDTTIMEQPDLPPPRPPSNMSRVTRCSSPTHSMISSTSSSITNAQSSQSAPSSPCKARRPTPSPSICDSSSPLPRRHVSVTDGSGYRPSAIYQTKTTYRSQRYPTLSTKTHSVISQYDNVDPTSYISSPYKHKFDSVVDPNIDQSGQYSISTQRASRAFDTHTDIQKMDSVSHVQSSTITHGNTHANIGRSTSCHNNLDDVITSVTNYSVDSRRRPLESRSLDNLDCDDVCDQVDGTRNCDDKVYVAGNVSSPPYKPLTINTKNNSQDSQNFDSHQTMQSPRHLPRLRLPMYSEVQQETNFSPNVLRSPRELNFSKADTSSPLSPTETEKMRRSPKEWYESNLDSPLPVRRSVSQVSSPMSDLLTTVQQIGDSSPPSPHKVETRTTVYSPPLINPRSPTEQETKQIISVGHFKPYHEEIKPYETSDFYKYSRKHRNKSASSDTTDVSSHTSPSQVLHQVAEKVLTNPALDRSFDSSDSSHVYEPINVQCSGSGAPHCKLSPRSMSQYRPPKAMTCEPLVQGGPVNSPTVAADRSGVFNQSMDSNNSSMHADRASLADAFHNEMLAWYDGQENNSSSKKATLV